jgi:hypothetical protein
MDPRRSDSRAARLLRTIERRKERVRGAFYDIGAALAELADKKLYRALGYTSIAELVVHREIMSPAQAFKFIEVARRFSRAEATALGAEKAYALARYATRAGADADLASFLARGFPIARERRPLTAVTVRQIVEATQCLGDDAALRAGALREVAEWRRDLRARGVRATAALFLKNGEWHVRVEIPAKALRRVIR